MIAQKNFIFYKDATSPGLPKEDFNNISSEIIAVEISGDFTEGRFVFEGKTNLNTVNYTPLAAINLTDFSVASEVSNKGIYEIGIEGVQVFRVRIESISGGAATIFGRVLKTGV